MTSTEPNLFKKAAVFTDLHIGLKGNSPQHNADCMDFIDWFISKSKEEGCETCLFLGDWHHHRSSINMLTQSYSTKIIEKLNDAFEQVFMITGNHDLFYRDRREVHAIEWATHLPNVTIVDKWFEKGNVIITPWLVGKEYMQLPSAKAKYLFGHFELPNFHMNANVVMPDHGELNPDYLTGFDYVFSGHFHKRQARKNIWYIGNAFPHNFSDAGDDARGMMILEWGEETEINSWPSQPTYRVYYLSNVLENPEGLLLPKSTVRINLDIEISFEESSFIKESLIPEYGLREMILAPIKKSEHTEDNANVDISFESVEQIITDQITNIESEFYDKKLLLDLYNSL